MIFKAAEGFFRLPRRICSNIREAFQVAELILMIRATRGRSMDGWMDGWSRPNHMPSRLDALQTTTSVDLRQLPGELHSVAKQASFYVAFQSDFGRFGKPKSMPKLDF